MASKIKAFIFMLILMLVLLPPILSSRARFEDEPTMATKDFEANGGSYIFHNIVEDSAREVPTGPDPLHHNDNPTGP